MATTSGCSSASQPASSSLNESAPRRGQPLDGVVPRSGHLEPPTVGPVHAGDQAALLELVHSLAQPVGVDPQLRPDLFDRGVGTVGDAVEEPARPRVEVEAGPTRQHHVELAPVLVADGALQDELDLVEGVAR